MPVDNSSFCILDVNEMRNCDLLIFLSFISATGGDVIQSVYDFSHFLADVIVFGFATSQSAPIEPGEGENYLIFSQI